MNLKLFPTLRGYLDSTFDPGTRLQIHLSDIGEGRITLRRLIEYLGLPQRKVHLAIVNGRIVRDFDLSLKEEDTVYLSPAVGGG